VHEVPVLCRPQIEKVAAEDHGKERPADLNANIALWAVKRWH
jgi:hypothetical protein